MSKRRWTEEEVKYLEENVGSKSVQSIAKKLNRSIGGVRRKMFRLGMGCSKYETSLITLHELSALIEIHRNTLKKWVENYGLPVIRKATFTTQKYTFVDPVKFWKWAENHKELINFYRIPKNALIPEPDWVDGMRKIDYYNKPLKLYKPWTAEEDTRLLSMVQARYKYREIAKVLKRSQRSVEKRMGALKAQGRVS